MSVLLNLAHRHELAIKSSLQKLMLNLAHRHEYVIKDRLHNSRPVVDLK